MNQPLSPHWADIAALKIVNKHHNKESYTVASGITPSGRVHIGNFREVVTVDLVARALKKLGKTVRFIYSWDNFDTFRKVPKNVPSPEEFAPYLRRPIARIPDPWGNSDSYAQGRIQLFEEELKKVGIYPEYRYQETLYAKGTYAESIKKALEHRDEIKAILDKYRSEPLNEDWLPTSVYCSKCQKDTTEYEKYLGGYDYRYKCSSCGNEETLDLKTSPNIKLAWRTDWPMRWEFEKVDFEPGGKDHSSQGGSYDTAKEISQRVWGFDPPVYLQYDFVAIKGGTGKMSSSSGELYTLSDVLEVYTPAMVRWIFSGQRPNHDFSLAFDEDVIKVYEEFDRAEEFALSPCPNPSGKWPLIRRSYELSLVDENAIPNKKPFRPGFRDLCNRLQICSGDIERTLIRYYANDIQTEDDRKQFFERARCALIWLDKHAPDMFKYEIQSLRKPDPESDKLKYALEQLKLFISENNLDRVDSKELNQRIYDIAREAEIEAKEIFKEVYQRLIGRDQGPRLPTFLKELGKDLLLELL